MLAASAAAPSRLTCGIVAARTRAIDFNHYRSSLFGASPGVGIQVWTGFGKGYMARVPADVVPVLREEAHLELDPMLGKVRREQ